MERVNNCTFGLYQDGEIYIDVTPDHLERSGNRIYVTVIELKEFLKLAQTA